MTYLIYIDNLQKEFKSKSSELYGYLENWKLTNSADQEYVLTLLGEIQDIQSKIYKESKELTELKDRKELLEVLLIGLVKAIEQEEKRIKVSGDIDILTPAKALISVTKLVYKGEFE